MKKENSVEILNKKINELEEKNKFLISLVNFYVSEINLINDAVNLKDVGLNLDIDIDVDF